jgi:competence/damage-inducible protein CinA-like protein
LNSINATIITIGDELLIGQTIDTNSAWMAGELNNIGVWVKRKVSVGDVWDDMWNALDEESKKADVILMTGGLGPTSDDITKPLLCKYFGGTLVVNEKVLAHVKYLFEKVFRRQGPMLERNLKQAEVPDNCTVLMNERGTAPGMMFEKDSKLFFSLPGVPHEMKGLMTNEVLPRIKQHFKLPFILHQTLLTFGTGESMIAEKIKGWEEKLPPHLKLAYLPHYGSVRLRLTGTGDQKEKLQQEISDRVFELKELVREWLVADEDKTIPQVIARTLKERNQTLGTAESCTGGYIAHLLTTDAGASKYFKGTIVAYDNSVKQEVLGVSPETLETVGAVSEEAVKEMVKGVLENLKTDYALATSGIMGPDGGTEEKPVGTVWIAVGDKNKIEAKQLHLRFDRMRNIEQTSYAALNILRKFIDDNSYVS